MSEGPMVKGWCPGALRSMPSGDGLLVRVRPPRGRLTQAQGAGIAELSSRYGNGLIDLSARANLQMRGVRVGSLDAVLRGLASLGLLDPSVEDETKRNIIVTPYWRAGDGTAALAESLAAALGDFDASGLPGKFGFAVDTGETPVLRRDSADVRIERLADGSLICRADGATFGALVTPETAAASAMAIARWFVESGGQRRMSRHLAGGAELPGALRTHRAQDDMPAPRPTPGVTAAGVLIGLALGQIEADTLASLAGAAPLRLTPWRMLLLEGVTDPPSLPGVIVSPDDPLLRVVACVGAPGCAQALGPTRALARFLAGRAPANGLLHVSGCEKGCAHPRPAAITLVARADGFDLVRDGDAAARPFLRGLSAERLLADATILAEPG